jgi:hypothetical protein
VRVRECVRACGCTHTSGIEAGELAARQRVCKVIEGREDVRLQRRIERSHLISKVGEGHRQGGEIGRRTEAVQVGQKASVCARARLLDTRTRLQTHAHTHTHTLTVKVRHTHKFI